MAASHPEPVLAPAVLRELENILASPAFRMSSRSIAFLRHVVQYAHVPDELKERTLGVVLFNRAPDYDTGTDAIVRVKASEVRRRLAEYASHADPERLVRIELQPGSYAPRIITQSSQVEVAQSPSAETLPVESTVATEPPLEMLKSTPWWKRLSMVAAAVLICIIAAFSFWLHWWFSPGSRFLRPFLGSDKPIIGISHPNAYNLTRDGANGKGDALDALLLSERMQHLGRTSRIAVAQDITEQDLIGSPMILIGGPKFNYWTATLTQNLRFTFELVNDTPQITDRLRPTRFWVDPPVTDPQNADGYVVLTRLLATDKQKPVLSIAGLRAIDTRAGMKLIPETRVLDGLLKDAPDEWETKNLQWVLQVHQQKNMKPEVKLRAANYW